MVLCLVAREHLTQSRIRYGVEANCLCGLGQSAEGTVPRAHEKNTLLPGALRSQPPGFFDFGGELVESGDDAALFGEGREGNFDLEKAVGLESYPICGPLTGTLTGLYKLARAEVKVNESGIDKLFVHVERPKIVGDDSAVEFCRNDANRPIACVNARQEYLAGAHTELTCGADGTAGLLPTKDNALVEQAYRDLLVHLRRIDLHGVPCPAQDPLQR